MAELWSVAGSINLVISPVFSKKNAVIIIFNRKDLPITEKTSKFAREFYVDRLSIVFRLGHFPRIVLNVNPPKFREECKRSRKIDHEPSAVKLKVFFMYSYWLL